MLIGSAVGSRLCLSYSRIWMPPHYVTEVLNCVRLNVLKNPARNWSPASLWMLPAVVILVRDISLLNCPGPRIRPNWKFPDQVEPQLQFTGSVRFML